MKKLAISVFIMVLVGGVFALSPVWGLQLGPVWEYLQEENIPENPEMTARIQAFDPEDFTMYFDVYAAEELEAPTALLFDKKDDYHLPSKFWGEPLSYEEIVYAIRRLKDQYINAGSALPFEPRALSVINLKGEILGCVYTSIGTNGIVMDREEDGQVKVFPPNFALPANSAPGSISVGGADGGR